MKWTLVASAFALSSSAAVGAKQTYFPAELKNRQVSCNVGPPGSGIPVLSDLENRWYSDQLTAAHEPSLYLKASHSARPVGKSLRFTWLRSFHPPVIVRVDGLGTKNSRLIAKELSGAGGYAPGSIRKQLDRRLSEQEQKAIELNLSRTQVLKEPPKLCEIGLDGSQWIIEGVDGGGYHFVDRWSPESGSVREIGLMLLRMTGWNFKPIY